MAITIFTATATDESLYDAFTDGYKQLVAFARENKLDESGITQFEFFGETKDGRSAYRSFLHGRLPLDMYSATVYVEGPVFSK